MMAKAASMTAVAICICITPEQVLSSCLPALHSDSSPACSWCNPSAACSWCNPTCSCCSPISKPPPCLPWLFSGLWVCSSLLPGLCMLAGSDCMQEDRAMDTSRASVARAANWGWVAMCGGVACEAACRVWHSTCVVLQYDAAAVPSCQLASSLILDSICNHVHDLFTRLLTRSLLVVYNCNQDLQCLDWSEAVY